MQFFYPMVPMPMNQLSNKIILVVPPGATSALMYSLDEAGRLSAVLQQKGWETALSVGFKPADISENNIVILVLRWNGDEQMLGISECLKSKPAAVIAVGRIAGCFHQQLLQSYPGLTAVVLGEAEVTVPELLMRIEAHQDISEVAGIAFMRDEKIQKTSIRNCLDLDDLPWSDRRYLEPEFGLPVPIVPMESSRGCRGRCKFCVSNLGRFDAMDVKQIRLRTPEKVVAEIEDIVSRYHKSIFYFVDDNFFAERESGKKRAAVMAEMIKQRGLSIHFHIECRADDVEQPLFAQLKSAGLKHVFLGLESGSASCLERYQKGTTVEQNRQAVRLLNELQIEWTFGFILFDPLITWEELGENIRFIEEMKLHEKTKSNVYKHMFTYPGTAWEKELQSHNSQNQHPAVYFAEPRIPGLVMQLNAYDQQVRQWEQAWHGRQARLETLIGQIMQQHKIAQPYRFKIKVADQDYFRKMRKLIDLLRVHKLDYMQRVYLGMSQQSEARPAAIAEERATIELFIAQLASELFPSPLAEENARIEAYLLPKNFRVDYKNQALTLPC